MVGTFLQQCLSERFILFFGKTKYRLQTFDTRDYNMLAMHTLCIIICCKKLTFFLLNFCGKDFKSLEASYLPVAFAAGMAIESIELCCFRIVVLFQKISSPLSWRVFWFDTSPLSISLEIPVSVHTLLLKIWLSSPSSPLEFPLTNLWVVVDIFWNHTIMS